MVAITGTWSVRTAFFHSYVAPFVWAASTSLQHMDGITARVERGALIAARSRMSTAGGNASCMSSIARVVRGPRLLHVPAATSAGVLSRTTSGERPMPR
jgi:hypothetical protein